MKNYYLSKQKEDFKFQYFKELKAGGFQCNQCKIWVPFNEFMGTKHRNHCNVCLWSKHVDDQFPGDRRSNCHGGMKPIALTLKDEEELMILHICGSCDKLSKNRIAADDFSDTIFEVFKVSQQLHPNVIAMIERSGIVMLTQEEKSIVSIRLFGE